MQEKIAIITSVVGGTDELKFVRTGKQCYVVSDVMPVVEPNADGQWNFVQVGWNVTGDRRRSHMVKCVPWQFIDADISIWVDGSLRFKDSPDSLVEYVRQGADMAVFRSTKGDCVYDEADLAIKRGCEEPSAIAQQVARYKADGFPTHWGMSVCNIVVRRHNQAAMNLGNAWWSEQTRWSCHDILSFNYLSWKIGLKVAEIPGDMVVNGLCVREPHIV